MDKKESQEIAIYLAGGIQKGHDLNQGFFWTEKEIGILQESLKPLKAQMLNPAFRSDNLSNQYSVFGRDMLQVYSSDCVFVDAREKRGLGVGAEMMWAKLHNIPVVTYAPKGTHYNLQETHLLGVHVTNWIHPFVESLSDIVVEALDEGANWMKKALFEEGYEIKGIEHVKGAMHYYIESGLESDLPMQELIATSARLQAKVEKLSSLGVTS